MAKKGAAKLEPGNAAILRFFRQTLFDQLDGRGPHVSVAVHMVGVEGFARD